MELAESSKARVFLNYFYFGLFGFPKQTFEIDSGQHCSMFVCVQEGGSIFYTYIPMLGAFVV